MGGIDVRRPWTIVGREIVNAGPVDREEILRVMAAAVTPARAISFAAMRRRAQDKYALKTSGRPCNPTPEWRSDDVMVGARAVASEVIYRWLKSGTWVALSDGRIATREWAAENQPDVS